MTTEIQQDSGFGKGGRGETGTKEEEISNKSNQPKRKESKRKKLKRLAPLLIGIGLVLGLAFLWSLYGVAIAGGVRLLNLSEQPYDPQNLKASDASKGALLIALGSVAVFFLTPAIIAIVVMWRKKFKRSAHRHRQRSTEDRSENKS